jgi:hypothetical protein
VVIDIAVLIIAVAVIGLSVISLWRLIKRVEASQEKFKGGMNPPNTSNWRPKPPRGGSGVIRPKP